MDTRSAFLVQKCAYEYSRARAGIMSRKLFREEGFKEAMKKSSWLNYPLGLEIVSVMVEHTLHPHALDKLDALRRGVVAAADAVTERYPIPEDFSPRFWADARDRIAARVDKAGLSDPKPIRDIPLETAEEFITNLPIHESVMQSDRQLVTNNLRFNICRMHDDLTKTADLELLANTVAAGPNRPEPPTLTGSERA